MRLILLLFLLASTSILADSSKKAGLEDPNARSRWIQSTYENKNVPAPDDFYIRQQRLSNSLPNAPEGLYAKGSQISSQTWMHAGPNNVGGRTRALEYDRTNPDVIIAGGVSGGIWRSVDGGNSWVQTSGIKEIASVTAIIQDPRPGRNNEWYCAGGELHGGSASRSFSTYYSGNGIFKSTDNGLSWEKYGETGDDKPQVYFRLDHVLRLTINPTNLDEDILYAACSGHIVTISANGTKFESTLGLDNYNFSNLTTDILITSSGKYYATLSYQSIYYNQKTSHSGIFYSEDGKNWENISPDFLQPSHRIIMDYSESNDEIVYFFVSNINELSTGCEPDLEGCIAIFKLNNTNNNLNWTDLSHNIPTFGEKNHFNTISPQKYYCMAIAVSPTDTNTVIIAGNNCFVSYDGFATPDSSLWIGGFNKDYEPISLQDTTKTITEIYANLMQIMHPNSGWDYHWFTFNPENPNEVLSASDHGIHKLPDLRYSAPKDWTDLNNGYCTTQFYDCAINKKKAGDNAILGGTQDNGILGTFPGTNNYAKYWPGDGFSSYIAANNSIVISDYDYILRLDLYQGQPYNGGMIDIPITDDNKYGLQFNTEFAVNPYNESELTTATAKVIAYCDNINTVTAWENYTYHFIDNLDATCIEYLAPSVNGVLIGTQHKKLIKVNELKNEDFDYEIIELPDFVTGKFVSDIWTDPQDVNHFVAIVSNYLTLGMLETYDNGATWTDHGGNLEEFPDGSGAGHSFRCYERMVYEGDTLHLLGTSDGLFSTKKLEGANTIWMREGANSIGKAVIEDIEVRELDGRIVIATHGNGLFKTNYATSVSDFNGSNLGFVVSEVYPNPASNKINFVVNSDNASFVEAKLMDLNGREIANIISEEFRGTKRIDYDITDLNAGTYFLHISDGNHYVTKKVNVVR